MFLYKISKLIIIIIQMKRKEDKQEVLTLDFLQKKYQEQKLILFKENKRLSAQLTEEIERYNQLVMKVEKNEKSSELQYEQLLRENQEMKARILQLQQEKGSILEQESQQFETLNAQKQLMVENQKLVRQNQQLIDLIYRMQEEKNKLAKQKIEEHDELHRDLLMVEKQHEEYKKQAQQKIEQLQLMKEQLAEEKQKESIKYSELKKKKKDLEKKMQELEKKIEEIAFEENRREEEIIEQRRLRNKEQEKYHEITTKLALAQSNIANLEQFIASSQGQLKEQEKRISNENQLNEQLSAKLQKMINNCKALEEENFKLIQENKRLSYELQQSNNKEEMLKAIRKTETEELIGLIKQTQQQGNSNPQRYSQNNSNSQTNLNFGSLPMTQDRALQKTKMEMIINSLQSEVSQLRKQLQSSNYETNRLRRLNQDQTLQLERRQSQIREIRMKWDRQQNQRNRELLNMRNQNQLLRCLQTEKLQKEREMDEYKAAVAMKLAFYERKIKQHLDTIDRKQTIIEKLQLQKNQAEDKQKIVEQHLKRLTDETEFLKKFKQDCGRKDELMKEYKNKLEKIKLEQEETKNELGQLKKEKNRLEKQLESKQQYLNHLKSKQDSKPAEDVQKDNKRISELKNNYQHKLSAAKKEKEEMAQQFNAVREAVLEKVEACLAKHLNNKKQVPQYQAAKLLGIKPGEIQQFLNPGCVMGKKITQQLEELWFQRKYALFVSTFIQYLDSQKSL